MTLRNVAEDPGTRSDDRGTVEPIRIERYPDDRRKTRLVLMAAAAGLVGLVLIYFVFIREKKPAATAAGAPGAAATAPAAPVPISTVSAVKREVPIYVEASGSLTPYETTDVAPLVAGKVVATPVDAGSWVDRGSVLARLDDRDARLNVQKAEAAVSQAEAEVKQQKATLGISGGQPLDPTKVAEVQSAKADLDLARANEGRYRRLVETGDVPQAEYDQYRARAETAQRAYEAAIAKARSGGAGIDVQESALQASRAQLAIAKKALADCTIVAPLSGYVVERPTAVGEWVTTSSKIATMVQNDVLKLLLQVAEADAARVKIGMPAKLRVQAFPDREFDGMVSEIIPSLDPNSRAMIAVVGVRNSENLLKPGMFATTRVVEPSAGNLGILVPAQAVVRTGTGSSLVYVIKDGHAEARAVRTGQEVEGMIQIVDGVNEGEAVATAGAEKLADGAPVTVGAS